MEARPSALPLLRFSCGGCGYGASTRSAPKRCPMCGSEGAWVEEGWKLFADLAVVTKREAADADAPLQREAEEPSVLPGIPLT
jgi:hypothetical protein